MFSWTKHFLLTGPPSALVYKWILVTCIFEAELPIGYHPMQEGAGRLLVETTDERRLDGRPSSDATFTYLLIKQWLEVKLIKDISTYNVLCTFNSLLYQQ